MKKLLIGLLTAILTISAPISLSGADEVKPAKEKRALRALPLNGKISAIDKNEKSIKVGERTFYITAETQLTKNGKPATLDDAVVGEIVGASYRQSEDKKLQLVSLRIGPKAEKTPKDVAK